MGQMFLAIVLVLVPKELALRHVTTSSWHLYWYLYNKKLTLKHVKSVPEHRILEFELYEEAIQQVTSFPALVLVIP
jgi:hypothetical protein